MTPSQPQSTQSAMPMPSEPQSTQNSGAPMPSQPEPSIHPTMQPPVQSTQSPMPQPSEPQQQPQPEPSSPNQPEPSQPASSQPPMPQMHATFYIEFGIYDDIDSIHSVELERELNENYAGIWIVDPAVVYDAHGAAVGVTFNAEVDISGRLSPGFPMGSIILDKVAELLTEEDGQKNGNGNGGGNGPDNVLAASNAHIIESKRVFGIDYDYYPVVIVCAAIGVTIVFAAKFYLKQFGKKEYEPLLG